MSQNISVDNIKELVSATNAYVSSNKSASMKEVEDLFRQFFDVQAAKFWKADIDKEILYRLDDETGQIIYIEEGLLKESISTKKTIIENHVVSNKYYVPAVDAPLDFRVKSILFFPVLKSRKVIGLVSLYRRVGDHKVLTVNDKDMLLSLMPFIESLVESREISKVELLELLKENSVIKKTTKKKDVTSKRIVVKKIEKKKEISVKSVKDKNVSIKKRKDEEALPKKEPRVAGLEKELQESLEKEKRYQEKIKLLEEQQQLFKAHLLKLKKEKTAYQSKETKLLEQVAVLETQNKNQEKEYSHELKQVKSLVQLQRKDISNEKDEYRMIMQKTIGYFGSSQHARVMFDLIVLAMYSPKGLGLLEQFLSSADIQESVIEKYSLKETIPIDMGKYRVSDLVKTVQKYQNGIFYDKIRLNIDLGINLPLFLYFDIHMVEKLILHLLLDLFEFVDHSQRIDLTINYINRELYIEINSKVHEKNSVFNAILKRGNLIDNKNGRASLQFATKLLDYLGGTLKNSHKNNEFNYIAKIPAKIINL